MRLKNLYIALLSLVTYTSCDMMTEEIDDTNCGLFVNFKYDYNLQRADMFKDHVGGIRLYVFDNNGTFVTSYEENNIPSMGRMVQGEYLYCMQITDLPSGSYQLIALANQKSYESTLATPGAKYRVTAPTTGDGREQLSVTLDRQGSQTVEGRSVALVSDAAPLDTLWHGMTTGLVEVNDLGQSVATISMVRDTKMLTIGLHNLDEREKADIDADEFDFYILDANGRLAYDNSASDNETLAYTPFHKWNTEVPDANGAVVERTAHACLTFNRLMYHATEADNALLVIRNKTTGQDVAVLDLPSVLSQGRNAFDTYAYSEQDFLDRGYDFYLDFFLLNGKWQYVEVRLGVLSWAKRIVNIDLD